MSQSKVPAFLLGWSVGLVVAGAAIGFMLVGTAVVAVLQDGSAGSLLKHPLYVAGSDLVLTSLLAGLPVYAVLYFRRKP